MIQGLRTWWQKQTGEDETPFDGDSPAFIVSLLAHLALVVALGLVPVIVPNNQITLTVVSVPVTEEVVELKVPDDSMGKVMGDLSSRRGKILGMDSDGRFQIVKAQVPAMELYHYSTVLRSLTGGRGIHTEEFNHYEEMPRELEQKVITESKKRKAEES